MLLLNILYLPCTSLLPAQHAFALLRLCGLPRMNFWSRVISPTSFRPAAIYFDQLVIRSASHIFKLSSTLSDVAQVQLSLPISAGGFGLRRMDLVSPVAWWSALAQAVHHINALVPSIVALPPTTPFVISQATCHTFLSRYDLPLDGSLIPSSSHGFWSKFGTSPPTHGLQRLIMRSYPTYRFPPLTTLV